MTCEKYLECSIANLVRNLQIPGLESTVEKLELTYCKQGNGMYCDHKAFLEGIEQGRTKLFSKK